MTALCTATSSGGTGDDAIHIAADTVGERFTLGQSITQWGVVLTQTGGVSAAPSEKVEVTSNGILVPGDPADRQLDRDQQIELRLRRWWSCGHASAKTARSCSRVGAPWNPSGVR